MKKNPFLVKLNDIKIFIFPYRLRLYDRGWTESSYVARAYSDYIVVGGTTNTESLASIILHELAHIFQKRFISDLSEYKRLRNIPSDWQYDAGYYYKRYSELFAEDFRVFFGTPETQKDTVDFYQEIEKPSNIIKDYILSKIPAYEEIKLQINSKLMVANQIPLQMDVAPFIKENRTYVPLRFVAEQLGVSVLWFPETQEIKLLK